MAQDLQRDLNGPEKAAAILLAMGKPPASRLVRHLEAEELRVVTRAAAQLGSIPVAALEKLVEQFSADFAMGANLLGDAGQAKELLVDALPPDQVNDILNDALGERATPDVWSAVSAASVAALAEFLKDERGSTATYVLSKIDSAHAAKVVAAMPREQRNAVLCGMVSPPNVTHAAAQMIEKGLREGLLKSVVGPSAAEHHQRIARILNSLDPAEAEDALQALGSTRPKDAKALKGLLFTFNDLPRLSERARALLFDRAATDVVVLALRGTEPEFRDAALSSMPSRARRLVEGELSNGASPPAREIAKARRTIGDIVLGMAQRGEIELQPVETADAA